MTTDDAELLRRYVSERSQEAFAELVRRYLPFVFSAAVRRLNGDVHRASDVSQIVFAAVARDARKLSRHRALTAWLYTATRHTVIDLVRTENRRLAREQEADQMQALSNSSDHSAADWEKLRPVIDEVLDLLPTHDREVVLLRFFQSQTYQEIGYKMRLNDEAVRKRVERALEVVRRLLMRRGISSTSAALAAILGSETIVAAPAGLASSIVSSALLAPAAVTSIAFLTVTKFQAGILATLLLGGAAGLLWQQRTIAQWRTAQVETQSKTDQAAAENMNILKARAAAEEEVTKLRAELAALRERNEVVASTATTSVIPDRLGGADHPVAAVPRDPQQLARLHQRYDPFLERWGFTQARKDRWIELMMDKENTRLDLQEAMWEFGVRGGSTEVEAFRSRLTGPFWKQMEAMLGPEGVAAFPDYEQVSAYRGYLDRLIPRLSAANSALTAQQFDQLLHTIAHNKLQRKNPGDPGTTSQIDWASVEQQTKSFLNPTQQTVLSDFLQRGRD